MPLNRLGRLAMAMALIVPTGAVHPETPAIDAARAAPPLTQPGATPASLVPATGTASPAPDGDNGDGADAGTDLGTGIASYYGRRFDGRMTASGERFDMTDLTAAHRSLPFGSHVRVTNLANGESVVVRINDRGPYHGNRVIDLSRAAAEEIGLIGPGRGKVDLELLEN